MAREPEALSGYPKATARIALWRAATAYAQKRDAPHRTIPIARFDPVTTEYCLFEADVITSESIAVSNVSSEGCTVQDRLVSLSSIEWTVTDLLAPAFPTCDIPKDVLENAASGPLLILPSLVERGGDITIPVPRSAGPLTAEVLDMAGRIVRRMRPNGLDRIALTLDVDPGSYAVRVRDASGKLIGSGRVIVR